jgi:hypothetical protein
MFTFKFALVKYYQPFLRNIYKYLKEVLHFIMEIGHQSPKGWMQVRY